MEDDIPFFMNQLDDPDANSKNYIWNITLLGGSFVGKVVWCQRDVNGHPIMVSIEQKHGDIVEIPWTSIQCITYEGTK